MGERRAPYDLRESHLVARVPTVPTHGASGSSAMKVFLPNDKNYVELGETGDLLYVQAIANGTMISYNEVPLLTNPRPIAWRIRHVGDTVCLGWQLSSSGSFEDSTCLSHPAWRPEASYAELAYWSRQALASDGYAYFDAVNP